MAAINSILAISIISIAYGRRLIFNMAARRLILFWSSQFSFYLGNVYI